MDVNFGRTAVDYAAHRAGFPTLFYDRLTAMGVASPGSDLLDIGAGTGALARAFAARGCRVTALDPSTELLAEAARLAAREGLEIATVEATAESTGLSDVSFDTVTAGTCWHWFDKPAAAKECFRVLRVGGRLVLAWLQWLPLPNNVVTATEALIAAHNPSWPMGGLSGIYGEFLADLSVAGFVDLETFSFDRPIAYSHEGWRGRIRASAGVGASLSPDAVAQFDAAHAAMLTRDFPENPLQVPHRVWAVIGVKSG